MAASLLLVSLAACGGSSQKETQGESAESAVETQVETSQESAMQETETQAPTDHTDTLVAYFSVTGNTKGVAEKIASITGGDLYEIQAAEPYVDEDLNYNDDSCRATKEQNDKSVRPEIGSSGIGNSGSNMESLVGSGTWLDGERFSAGASTEEIQAWIDELK